MNEKWYEFHWKDGNVDYVKGDSVTNAAAKAGISAGALSVLDHWALSKDIPLEHKEVYYTDLDGKETVLANNTMFAKMAKEAISKGLKEMEIKISPRAIFKCIAEIKPFEIYLTEIK